MPLRSYLRILMSNKEIAEELVINHYSMTETPESLEMVEWVTEALNDAERRRAVKDAKLISAFICKDDDCQEHFEHPYECACSFILRGARRVVEIASENIETDV